MATFKIEIKETLARTIEVEADDFITALKEVEGQYNSEDIVLDSDDHVETEFIDMTEGEDG